MQHDKKYSEQLSLAFKRSGVSKSSAARKAYVSPAQMTKLTQGTANAPKSIKKVFSKLLQQVRLNYSSARADYNVISFMQSKRVTQDLFSATRSADKEERDTQNIEDDAFDSASVPRRERTKRDWENIHDFTKERTEEIGAEITQLIIYCDYVGIDPSEVITKFNSEFGG